MGELLTIRSDAVPFREYRDEVRCHLEVRLVLVGPERRKRFQPLLRRSPVIELELLALCRLPNSPLRLGIGDYDEVPRLEIRPTRRRGGGFQTRIDYRTRNGAVGELPHRSPTSELVAERNRPGQH